MAKLCGLLGSSHSGERAAAALKADQLLKAHGLRWPDVICVPCAEHAHEEPPDDLDDDYSVDWDAVIVFCWERRERLKGRDLSFLDSMRSWNGLPTERQRRWIKDIARRLMRTRR